MNILLSALSSLTFAVGMVLVVRLSRSKNKTLPIFVALLFLSSFSHGQTAFPYNSFRCGTWAVQPEYFTTWETIDTLGDKKNPVLYVDSLRLWVYDQEQYVANFVTDDVYRPCGADPTERYFQWRMCKLTGIRQKRYRVIPFKYVEHERTVYERLEDSLSDIRDRGTGEGGLGAVLDTLAIGFTNDSACAGEAMIYVPRDSLSFYKGDSHILHDSIYFNRALCQVCRNVTDTRKTGWTARPFPLILWQTADGKSLNSKKHPLKPWIRVWEN